LRVIDRHPPGETFLSPIEVTPAGIVGIRLTKNQRSDNRQANYRSSKVA
jgi:hypothetical protein